MTIRKMLLATATALIACGALAAEPPVLPLSDTEQAEPAMLPILPLRDRAKVITTSWPTGWRPSFPR